MLLYVEFKGFGKWTQLVGSEAFSISGLGTASRWTGGLLDWFNGQG